MIGSALPRLHLLHSRKSGTVEKPNGGKENNNIYLWATIFFAILAGGIFLYAISRENKLNPTIAAPEKKLDNRNQTPVESNQNKEQLTNVETKTDGTIEQPSVEPLSGQPTT